MNSSNRINNTIRVNSVDHERLQVMVTEYIDRINRISSSTYFQNETPHSENNVDIRCQICYDPTCSEYPCSRSDSAK